MLFLDFLCQKTYPGKCSISKVILSRSYLGKCSPAFLKNGKLTCPNQDCKCWLGHAQCQFLIFYKCHKIWTTWSQRLVLSEFSCLYDTYYWWKFQKSPWSKDHHLFNNQSIQLSSSSKNDNIIQEAEKFLKQKSTVGLPEVSKLIDSVMSKRQGDQREHSFLDKKYFIKGKINSLWTPKNITAIDGWYYEAIDSSISQEIFSYLKMLSMQCRKNI